MNWGVLMRLPAVIALFVFLVSPLPAQAKWLEVSSEHFVIYADDKESDAVRFTEQLERYHAGMAMLTGTDAPAPSPSNRVTIYVVRSADAVRKLYGEGSAFVNGFYVPRAGASIAIVPQVDSTRSMSMTVLLHEYAHHFLIGSSSRGMPRWFSEGGAEFFASVRFEKDGGATFGMPANHRAAELFYGVDVDVADLFDPARYAKRTNRTYDAFYGKSWLLYHYLTFSEARKGQMAAYLKLLTAGKSQPDAAREALGDFDVLEAELARYKKQKLVALKLRGDLFKPVPFSVRELSAGEAAIMPVRIRSARGVDEELAAKVVADARRIAAEYPADAGVLTALAEAEQDAGNQDAAIAAADAALAIDPTRANAYIQKGLALFAQAGELDGDEEARIAAFNTARKPFIALNRLEHDHPLPLIFFYRSYTESGREPTALAIEGLTRACELAPFDLGLRMNLGAALAQAGEPELAIRVLQVVANNPHKGGLAQAAESLIAALADLKPGQKFNVSMAFAEDEGVEGGGDGEGDGKGDGEGKEEPAE